LGPFLISKPLSLIFGRDTQPEAFSKWISKGKGPLSSTGFQATAAIASSFAHADNQSDWPDLTLTLYGNSVDNNFIHEISRSFGLKQDEIWKYYGSTSNLDSFHILVQPARPKSRGQITLNSAGKNLYGLNIDPNYLGDEENKDFRILAEGVKIALQLVENFTTFQNLGAKFTTSILPGT